MSTYKRRVSLPWVWPALLALLLTILGYLLLIAIPVYGSGIDHMSLGEIYQASNERSLVGWYPLYQGADCCSGVYGWAALAYIVYPVFTVPLTIGLLVNTRRRWPYWSLMQRIPWMVVFALYILVTIVYFMIYNQAGAWLWD